MRSDAGKRGAPVPQGPPTVGPRRPRAPHPVPPPTRPGPGSSVPRQPGGGPPGTWRVITEQEALELHSLAPGPHMDRIRSHGNVQTAAERRGACAGAWRAPGVGSSELRVAARCLGCGWPGAENGSRPVRRRRGAGPAPAVTRICLGAPGGGRGLHGAAPGQRSRPRRRRLNLHFWVPGTRSPPVLSKGDLIRADAQAGTAGLGHRLGCAPASHWGLRNRDGRIIPPSLFIPGSSSCPVPVPAKEK